MFPLQALVFRILQGVPHSRDGFCSPGQSLFKTAQAGFLSLHLGCTKYTDVFVRTYSSASIFSPAFSPCPPWTHSASHTVLHLECSPVWVTDQSLKFMQTAVDKCQVRNKISLAKGRDTILFQSKFPKKKSGKWVGAEIGCWPTRSHSPIIPICIHKARIKPRSPWLPPTLIIVSVLHVLIIVYITHIKVSLGRQVWYKRSQTPDSLLWHRPCFHSSGKKQFSV